MIRAIRFWLILPLVTVTASALIIGLIGPTWGIDFTGGALVEIEVTRQDVPEIRTATEDILDSPAQVQVTGANNVLIRTKPLSEDEHQLLLEGLKERGLASDELRFESIGPTIGQELRSKALTAVGVVVVALIAYLAYTFRQAAGMIAPWKFGAAAVYALVHDLLVVTAVFVILGQLKGVVIDSMFVTAMLALLGYSVNDTIVIFNRLKQQWLSKDSKTLMDALESATKNSLVRSLNTSLTTLLVLVALLAVGGATIRWFIVALAIGTAVGTYSSLFVAPPVLYFLAKKR